MPPTPTCLKGVLLDVQTRESKGKSVIDVYVRRQIPSSSNEESNVICLTDEGFSPYFYVELVPSTNGKTLVKQLKEETHIGGTKPIQIEFVEREMHSYLRFSFSTIEDLLRAREEILHYPFTHNVCEANIPYTKRYLLDKQLTPTEGVTITLTQEGTINTITQTDASPYVFRTGAFDIETYGTGKIPTPEKNEIISIAATTPAGKKVFMANDYHNAYTVGCGNESAILNQFFTFLSLGDVDILYTYYGDGFDFPFIHERAKHAGITPLFGFGNVQLITRGANKYARLQGIQHIDVLQLMKLLTRFQVLKSPKLDLESVMRTVFGEGEKTLNHSQIWETWNTQKGLDKLAKYNLTDAEYTQRLGDEFLPLLLELSRLVHLPLYDVSRSTASQLVETILMNESARLQQIFPQPPTDSQVQGRLQNPIEGGYVKEPVAGLHTHLAVLDFRSMYPSIMISHNISPETLDCKHPACKKGANLSPTEHWFCTKQKGLFTIVLERILDARIAVQKKIDETPQNDPQLPFLKGRKQALKILLNSFFGTLAYPRFRWYSRESARAITAWARHYIHQTLQWAEKEGYSPLYADSDSAFLLLNPAQKETDIKKFVENVNKKLPGRMELEFEGLYKRGLFVTKKEGRAAKKRYALADYDHHLTIVGFEYVRRDHSLIARETQKKVLYEILINGKPENAHRIVFDVIIQLRAGKVPKKELVVLTQLQRKPESYTSIGPHVAAALKAQKRGKEIKVGQLLGYIITQTGKSISDKAELEEFVKEGDYDAEYYVHNQILPAIKKIFLELGYDTTDLERGGKQTGLGAFA
ncbi:MAG: DNA-directed DNA polymerase [Candidatus Diapherotrites archaeon]